MGYPSCGAIELELQFEGELDLAAGVGRGGDDAG